MLFKAKEEIPEIEIKSINQIRALGIDMINEASSGHPGIVLGAAPILYTLYTHHMKINPSDPNWINRDRFVMSAGHGSALLYATLHMAGYEISLDDLKFIKDELKSKIWAMHINDKILEEKTKELGFNIVNVKKSLHN